MTKQINIMIMVDSIDALIEQQLEGNCVMVDDSPLFSDKKGTLGLVTKCNPGNLIHWTVKAVDVQTPVSIKEISFGQPYAGQTIQDEDKLDSLVWDGYVPYVSKKPVKIHYKLVLEIGKGEKSQLATTSPSLYITPLQPTN
jgi:hypothetical protein